MISPKGKYRLWRAGFMALLFLSISSLGSNIVFFQNSLTDWVWFWETLSNLGKITLASFSYYYITKEFIHNRTHELSEEEKNKRENCLVIGVAIILAGVFSGS